MALAFGALVLTGAEGQQPPLSSDPGELNLPQAEWVKLYGPEQGINAPILMQSTYALQSKCAGAKAGGDVKFSFVVDSRGLPRNVVFEQALANEIDLLALKVILNSRFQPAMLNGAPVAVGRSAKMHLQICSEQTTDQSGKTRFTFRLRSNPEETVGDWNHSSAQANLAPIVIPPGICADRESNGFTPPTLLVHPPPPDAKGHSGKFSFKVLVDEHGVPQDLEVLKSTDPALLPQVTLCMRNLRFKPALKDGMPVPAHITEGLDITASQ
jgi:outer membrane biosynthesis protein TonB